MIILIISVEMQIINRPFQLSDFSTGYTSAFSKDRVCNS